MTTATDLDSRLDEALEETFPASDPPAVHSIDPPTDPDEVTLRPQSTPTPDAKNS